MRHGHGSGSGTGDMVENTSLGLAPDLVRPRPKLWAQYNGDRTHGLVQSWQLAETVRKMTTLSAKLVGVGPIGLINRRVWGMERENRMKE